MPAGWDEMERRARAAAQKRLATRRENRMRAEQIVRDMFTEKHQPISTGRSKMTFTTIDEATAALAGVASATMDQINFLGVIQTGIEEDAAATSALQAAIEGFQSEMADQATMMEQTGEIISDIREFLEGRAELYGQDMPELAGRVALALEEVGRVEEQVTGAREQTEELGAALTAPAVTAGELAGNLAGQAEATEQVRAQLSSVRHQTEVAQVTVDAIDS